MQAFSQRLIQVIGTALILAFFSEFYFLNDAPVRDLLDAVAENPFIAIIGFLELPAYYGLFAYPFLMAIAYFRVNSWTGLILAAALYGLATEALIVPLVYEFPPVSFIWTSLSWHTLVDVLLGWFILRRAMRARTIWPATILFAATGAFWGVWATWLAAESGALLTLIEFATLSITTSSILLVGIILTDRAPLAEFRASKAELIIISVISVALFSLTGFAYFPWPLAILTLLGLILVSLKAGQGHGKPDFLDALNKPPAWGRYLIVPLLPATAIAAYSIVLQTEFQLASEVVILPMVFAGGLSFIAALALPFWRKRRH